MQQCLSLAKIAEGKTRSNPMVGCVIAKNGKIISEGFHTGFGNAHAEIEALSKLEKECIDENLVLYVNLEPCCHYGKTPPCCEAILKSGIKNIIIGSVDPNPLVSGKGIEFLRSNGINVSVGLLDNENRELNKRFFTFYEKKRPYIILKWAQTANGFIAPPSPQEQFQISGISAAQYVHAMRGREQAILVGRNTVETDNPQLTTRLVNGENPIRLVFDKSLKTKNNFKIYNKDSNTIVFNNLINEKINTVEFIKCNNENYIDECLIELMKRNIQSLIVEGGAITLNKFIEKNLWDETHIITAPFVIENGISAPVVKGKMSSIQKLDNDSLFVITPLK